MARYREARPRRIGFDREQRPRPVLPEFRMPLQIVEAQCGNANRRLVSLAKAHGGKDRLVALSDPQRRVGRIVAQHDRSMPYGAQHPPLGQPWIGIAAAHPRLAPLHGARACRVEIGDVHTQCAPLERAIIVALGCLHQRHDRRCDQLAARIRAFGPRRHRTVGERAKGRKTCRRQRRGGHATSAHVAAHCPIVRVCIAPDPAAHIDRLYPLDARPAKRTRPTCWPQ